MRNATRGTSWRARARARIGFTLIEILVVIMIIGMLVALLIPAVQAARESGRRSQCSNNMKQIGLGLHNFESTYKKLPTGGEGTDYSVTPAATIFELHSTFTYLLPFIEQKDLYDQMNLAYSYRDTRWPGNQVATKTEISTYRCPSNPMLSQPDPQGYGGLDYFATVYTDIDPTTGLRNKSKRADGALCVPATSISAITDGASNTIAIIEDTGRTHPSVGYRTNSKYNDPACTGFGGAVVDPADAAGTANKHAVNRWADPDAGGSGVSGPPNKQAKYINNNNTPIGGPQFAGAAPAADANGLWDDAGCPWGSNNCGLNDEPFSFHAGGCNAVFADGSVHFLHDTLDGATLRRMVTRAEGIASGWGE
jgi:prepilin-type N-terminal cleavage/methylation domain-containing protein/prepilin-type processing-associated H-X9-DG protein